MDVQYSSSSNNFVIEKLFLSDKEENKKLEIESKNSQSFELKTIEKNPVNSHILFELGEVGFESCGRTIALCPEEEVGNVGEYCAAGMEETGLAFKVGLHALQLFEGNQDISFAQKEIFSLNSLLKEIEERKISDYSTEEILFFKKEIKKYENIIQKEIEKKKTAIEKLITSSMRIGVKSAQKSTLIASKLISNSTHLVHTTSFASVVAGNVSSLLLVILCSKELHINRNLATKISNEIKHVEQELEKFKKEKDDILVQILTLRLRNLYHQQESNRIRTVRYAMTLTSGVLGFGAIAKGVALATGATLGGVLGTTVSVTGIGAISMALCGGLIYGGYLIYEERFVIKNKVQNWGISFCEKIITKKIKAAEDKILNLTKVLELKQKDVIDIDTANNSIENVIEDYQEKICVIFKTIESVKGTKKELKEKLKNENNGFVFKKGIKSVRSLNARLEYLTQQVTTLKKEKIDFFIKKSEQQKKDLELSNEMRLEIFKMKDLIKTQQNNLSELKIKRQKLFQEFRYGKDLAKFGKNSEGNLTVSEMASIHQNICKENFNSFENIKKLKKFFSECNVRIDAKIFTKALYEGMDKEKYWDFIIDALSCSLK